MRRIRMDGWTLLTRDRQTYEIEIGGTIVGRVLIDRPDTGEDDILVTDYNRDIYEDGSSGGTYFTSMDDAWDYVKRTWADDIAQVVAHQEGQHKPERQPGRCPACAYTLRLARDWQRSDSAFRGLDWDDTHVVERYLHHAQKMSES